MQAHRARMMQEQEAQAAASGPSLAQQNEPNMHVPRCKWGFYSTLEELHAFLARAAPLSAVGARRLGAVVHGLVRCWVCGALIDFIGARCPSPRTR